MEDKHNFGILALVSIVAIVGLVVLTQGKGVTKAAVGTGVVGEDLVEVSEETAANLGGEAIRGGCKRIRTCLEYKTVTTGEFNETSRFLLGNASSCTDWGDGGYDPFVYGGIFYVLQNDTNGSMTNLSASDICVVYGTLHLFEQFCIGNDAWTARGICTEGCSGNKCTQTTTTVCARWGYKWFCPRTRIEY